jgi:2-C-methyl-D-erythritol 4-phosphate cytidylyltransferase
MGARKQYLSFNDKPMLQHTLERLIEMRPRQTVLVVAPDDREFEKITCSECCEIVTGADTRAGSVLNALRHLELDQAEWVMVHDAARPCVRPGDVMRLVTSVKDDDVGGLLAVPVVDTVKQVRALKVSATLDRQNLWLAQTPQIFRYGVLLRAMEEALAAGIPVTDEASAVEHLGLAPMVVEGHRDNIKVTRAHDLALAAWYLQQQANAGANRENSRINKQQDQR